MTRSKRFIFFIMSFTNICQSYYEWDTTGNLNAITRIKVTIHQPFPPISSLIIPGNKKTSRHKCKNGYSNFKHSVQDRSSFSTLLYQDVEWDLAQIAPVDVFCIYYNQYSAKSFLLTTSFHAMHAFNKFGLFLRIAVNSDHA